MKKPLPICLLLLRWTIFVVMLIWAIDKLIRPLTEAGMYERAYHLPPLPAIVMYAIGAFQILLATGFVIGLQKTLTAGLILLGMLIYTIASYRLYLPPFQGDNLLFFTAWPMLAVCVSLYLLRKQDTLLAMS
jgi:putative oxidoreductase